MNVSTCISHPCILFSSCLQKSHMYVHILNSAALFSFLFCSHHFLLLVPSAHFVSLCNSNKNTCFVTFSAHSHIWKFLKYENFINCINLCIQKIICIIVPQLSLLNGQCFHFSLHFKWPKIWTLLSEQQSSSSCSQWMPSFCYFDLLTKWACAVNLIDILAFSIFNFKDTLTCHLSSIRWLHERKRKLNLLPISAHKKPGLVITERTRNQSTSLPWSGLLSCLKTAGCIEEELAVLILSLFVLIQINRFVRVQVSLSGGDYNVSAE